MHNGGKSPLFCSFVFSQQFFYFVQKKAKVKYSKRILWDFNMKPTTKSPLCLIYIYIVHFYYNIKLECMNCCCRLLLVMCRFEGLKISWKTWKKEGDFLKNLLYKKVQTRKHYLTKYKKNWLFFCMKLAHIIANSSTINILFTIQLMLSSVFSLISLYLKIKWLNRLNFALALHLHIILCMFTFTYHTFFSFSIPIYYFLWLVLVTWIYLCRRLHSANNSAHM